MIAATTGHAEIFKDSRRPRPIAQQHRRLSRLNLNTSVGTIERRQHLSSCVYEPDLTCTRNANQPIIRDRPPHRRHYVQSIRPRMEYR